VTAINTLNCSSLFSRFSGWTRPEIFINDPQRGVKDAFNNLRVIRNAIEPILVFSDAKANLYFA
jgi:hypothetical protein